MKTIKVKSIKAQNEYLYSENQDLANLVQHFKSQHSHAYFAWLNTRINSFEEAGCLTSFYLNKAGILVDSCQAIVAVVNNGYLITFNKSLMSNTLVERIEKELAGLKAGILLDVENYHKFIERVESNPVNEFVIDGRLVRRSEIINAGTLCNHISNKGWIYETLNQVGVIKNARDAIWAQDPFQIVPGIWFYLDNDGLLEGVQTSSMTIGMRSLHLSTMEADCVLDITHNNNYLNKLAIPVKRYGIDTYVVISINDYLDLLQIRRNLYAKTRELKSLGISLEKQGNKVIFGLNKVTVVTSYTAVVTICINDLCITTDKAWYSPTTKRHAGVMATCRNTKPRLVMA